MQTNSPKGSQTNEQTNGLTVNGGRGRGGREEEVWVLPFPLHQIRSLRSTALLVG